MKRTFLILPGLIILFLSTDSQAYLGAQAELFPIRQGSRWGYIDKKGQVIIDPVFRSAGAFSEGLAPARIEGTYGFIDVSGQFLIPPQFDFAEPFAGGIAKVYVNGKPYFIDREGKFLFEHGFREIGSFAPNGLAIVVTRGERYGVIDRKGALVIDTIYHIINPFSDGVAVAAVKSGKKDRDVSWLVIDEYGRQIVPPGKYKQISDFTDGLATVELFVTQQKGWFDHEGIIDTRGKLRFVVPSRKWHLSYGNKTFSGGLATVEIFSVDPDTVRVWSSSKRYSYKGVIDEGGNIVFSNPSWDEVTPFVNNRAFIQDHEKGWFLINRKGEVLNHEPYVNIMYDSFFGDPGTLWQDGTEVVETTDGWVVIDTTGSLVTEPMRIEADHRSLRRFKSMVLFSEDISIESDEYDYRYGFWDIVSGKIVNAQFHGVNFLTGSPDVLFVIVDGRIGYVNRDGSYIWQPLPEDTSLNLPMNIDFMNRGYFYAASGTDDELTGHGGWGGSANYYKPVPSGTKSAKNSLYMRVAENDETVFAGLHKAVKLFIVNANKDTTYFRAQDSRLYLKLQAKDRKGKWRDIEYLPSSWCGNSYHTLFLPPGYQWEFSVPVYEGDFKTTLRAELRFRKKPKQKTDDILYSNEFSGSINLAQFWRKLEYHPMGIMDPYND